MTEIFLDIYMSNFLLINIFGAYLWTQIKPIYKFDLIDITLGLYASASYLYGTLTLIDCNSISELSSWLFINTKGECF